MDHIVQLIRGADSPFEYLVALYFVAQLAVIAWVYFILAAYVATSATSWLRSIPGGLRQKAAVVSFYFLLVILGLSAILLFLWLSFGFVKILLHPLTLLLAAIVLGLFALVKFLGRSSNTDQKT